VYNSRTVDKKPIVDGLVDFRWRLPVSGFRFATATMLSLAPREGDADPVPERYLVYAKPDQEHQSVKVYSPLVVFTGLFRRFAETPVTEEGIVAFANKYGALGGKPSLAVQVEGESAFRFVAESLQFWLHEIHQMKTVLHVWDSVRKTDRAQLSSFIVWNGGAVFFQLAGAVELIASEDLAYGRPDMFSRGDLVQPAMHLVQRRINAQLAEHAVTPNLLWDQKQGKLIIRMHPNSLIGALWLQFAKALEGEKQYRQCQYCRDWIEVGGNRSARSDKKFCSPSCKSAAHRRGRLTR
jgi:hypothetical protein